MIRPGLPSSEPEPEDDTAIVMEAITFLEMLEDVTPEQRAQLAAIRGLVERRKGP